MGAYPPCIGVCMGISYTCLLIIQNLSYMYMSILGLALTADNLTVILTGIEDKWKDIAQNLIVPKSEITRINNEHSSTTEKLRSVFKYSLKMHPFSTCLQCQ